MINDGHLIFILLLQDRNLNDVYEFGPFYNEL
jgi:hypothetical protein